MKKSVAMEETLRKIARAIAKKYSHPVSACCPQHQGQRLLWLCNCHIGAGESYWQHSHVVFPVADALPTLPILGGVV